MNGSITDLPGNAFFQLRLQQAILSAQYGIKQVGLLVVDYDRFDNTAMDVADLANELSEKIWARLRGVLRDSDTIVRMDGGEMAVLLPSVSGSEDVTLVAKKLVKTLEEPLLLDKLIYEIHPRIGIALFPEHSANANALIKRANAALNAAKTTNNNYVFYAQEQSGTQRAPLRMSELREAIVADQLFLLYQPKICLNTATACGLEVLTRWRHPQLGLISPDDFIPVAERTGLIIPLTLWVLHQSLQQCNIWNQMEMNVSMAVNLSMWNLEAQELPDQISGLLKNVGLSSDKLELEITESAIMVEPQRAMRTLMRIRDLGVSFTIDDFGTGYSSLAYLKKLPVSTIKIDKSFVKNMELDKDNAVIVKSIIDLGHNLGLKVVAEGVETREAQEMLTAFGCDEAQGFYYSRPLPTHKVHQILLNTGSSTPGIWKVHDERLATGIYSSCNGGNGKVIEPA